MSAGLLLQIAWRNLWRHTRRTVLTASAFGLGVFLLIAFLGLGDGMHEKMIETGIRMGSGHVVIQPYGAQRQVATDMTLSPELVSAIHEVLSSAPIAGQIKGSAPRLLASGLLSSANNGAGVQVLGAEAEREAELSLLPDRIVEGTYLSPDGKTPPVIIGRGLADKLKVKLGSKVVLMTQAGLEIQSQLLRVRGVFSTGMEDVDSHLISLPLADFQSLLKRPGALSEQAIFLHRADDAERVRTLIAAGLQRRPVSVLTWREAMPQLDQFVALDDAGNYIFNAILLIMVTLGVLNTALMAVLERRREFGLLVAMGMSPKLVGLMVMAESMMLTALGTGFGLVAGLAAHHYFAIHGLDIAVMGRETFSAAGVAVDTLVYSYLYPGRITWSLIFIGFLGLFAALYPALRAARTQPTEAMRGI